MYQLRRPHPSLNSLVEHYWFVTHEGDQPVDLRVDVFVDGRADLVINHGVSYKREIIGGPSAEIIGSNLDAQRLVPIRISQRGLVDIAGVRFHLGGLGAFVRGPLAAWTGATPPPELVFGSGAVELEVTLARTPDLDAKAALLDSFLLVRLDTNDSFAEFAKLLAALVESEGVGPVHRDATASERRNRARLFARHLGIPPRTVARILRFQHALRALMTSSTAPLAEVASDAGYYDQAHFIREFKAMTGGVPRGYRGYFPPEGPVDFAPNVVAFIQD